MFSKTLISAAALAVAVSAGPIHVARGSSSFNVGVPTSLSHVSFNNWGGFDCLHNFDDFYGEGNFDGSFNTQTVVTTQTEVVCESVDITVIQQQLAILTEFAKRVVTQQICQVEVQTIVWSQFVSSISSFSSDIRRVSGRDIGFDHSIASHISGLVDGSGNIIDNDFGFHGSDIGSNLIHVSGDNWVDGSSQSSVGSAFLNSQISALQSSSSFGQGSASVNVGSFGGAVPVGSF